MVEFLAENAQDASSPVRRLATKFGVIYAAAGLASELGVAPWPPGHGTAYVAAIFRTMKGSMSTDEEHAAKVLSNIALLLGDRQQCPRVERGTRVPIDKSGEPPPAIRRTLDNGREYVFVRNDWLRQIAGDDDRSSRLKQIWADKELIREWKGGAFSKQIKLIGYPGAAKPRFVFFYVEALKKVSGSR